MVARWPPADLRGIRTNALSSRRHKVLRTDFARPVDPAGDLGGFLDGLPRLLAAERLRDLAGAMARARGRGRPVLWALGAHVVKTGLAPVILQLADAGLVHGIALNGAGAVHDWEIAAVGGTSEEVEDGLHDGTFGTAAETGRALHAAAVAAVRDGTGLGEALAAAIETDGLPCRDDSLLAGARRRGIPVTVHVAIGCDVVHIHPDADGAAIGAATFLDFRRLVTAVGGLSGGVWINVGSAVQLPEVFLKALSAAANLGHDVSDLTTADLDMMRHYRTAENVLRRPTARGGRAVSLTGPHEILVPLLAAAALRAARGETRRP